jgi:hypothetical protein
MAATTFTEYDVYIGGVTFIKITESVLFPLQMDPSLPLPRLDWKQGETGGGRAAAWGGGVQEGGGREQACQYQPALWIQSGI